MSRELAASQRVAPQEPPPAFYALHPGGWGDLVTILHLPYTLLHLSFFALGGVLAPVVRLDRLLAGLTAFFLAVGIAAHFLDEFHGRPLRTRIPDGILLYGAVAALSAASLIGVLGVALVSPLLLGFIGVGVFAVVAYTLELWGGFFHGAHWFAFFWGTFPFLTGYWIMNEAFGLSVVPGAAACHLVALLQRTLSVPVRFLRRKTNAVDCDIRLLSGETVHLGREDLLAAPERALGILCISMPLLVGAFLIARLA